MIVGLCVGLVVGGCCAMAVGQRSAPRRAAIAGPQLDPATLPWLPGPIDMMIASGLQNRIRNPEDLATYVARWVYPVSASGQLVTWPVTPGSPPIFNRIYQRILIRVHRTLAEAAERAAGG